MELSHSFIVALMYVTVLSFGLAGLLTTLATVLNRSNNIQASGVHMHWILILLMVHFNMIWHTVFITKVNDWTYYSFLAITLGPILAFFAASVLTPVPSEQKDQKSLQQQYLGFKSQFLILFAGLQLWTLLADFTVGRDFTGSEAFNVGLFVLAVLLYFKSDYKLHKTLIWVVWALYLGAIVLRNFEVIA
jgi:hypothetical protein